MTTDIKYEDKTKTGLYLTTREYDAKGTQYLIITLVEYKEGKPTNTVGIKGLIKDSTRLEDLERILSILKTDTFLVGPDTMRSLIDPKLDMYAKTVLANTDNFERHLKEHVAKLAKIAPKGDMANPTILREKIANYVLVAKFDTII